MMSGSDQPATEADAPAVQLTDAAVAKVTDFAARHDDAAGKHLRIFIQGGSKAAYEYGFMFDDRLGGDEVLPQGDIDLLVDRFSLMYLEGSEVDFVDDVRGSGFVVNNPNLPPLMQDPVAAKVQQILEERINPGVASHGGWVSLIDYEAGRVFLKLGGGCQGCGMVDVTLKQGIERVLKDEIPDVLEVLDTTDHASGTNPYFSPGK
ncbi:MAG TPA: iron-sulfur cluster assembly accessory protein [Acidobacteriota bacterium]|nr:iron-sulfur cluster assembly accessory protein [Acidobacteriota bacterium]